MGIIFPGLTEIEKGKREMGLPTILEMAFPEEIENLFCEILFQNYYLNITVEIIYQAPDQRHFCIL